MFTCEAIQNGATYLSEHLAANDYYAQGEEVVGLWAGKGAEMLGLAGREIGPKDKAFEALRVNLHPETEEPLTQRTKAQRRAFYDFQCSAPKSVSIMATTFGDARLVAAHREALNVAFRELEKYAGRQDHRNPNERACAITGNLVAAMFTHDASRELDAQLHTHVVCANVTFDQTTGKWFALENSEMFKAIALAGRIYQAELAERVRKLGYEVEEDRKNGVVQGFEIAGVTEQDRETQSTRRKQIEAEIEKFTSEKGRAPSKREIHVIATQTRSRKLAEITTPEVRERQLAKYSAEDQVRLRAVLDRARDRSGNVPDRAMSIAHAAIDAAAEHLLERQAVVTRGDVLTWALQENLGKVGITQLREALSQSRAVVELSHTKGTPRDTARITSLAQLEREEESVQIVTAMQRAVSPLQRGLTISDDLGADQRRAVSEFLESRNAVHALLGRAGAGKTHTLREIDRQTRNAGLIPLYVAPTHAAKEVLQDDGFEHADTVTQLIRQLNAGEVDLGGRILVVDEAGMLSTRQGCELLRAAEKSAARVLLVGDEKQITSVEAGDWLGMLLRHAPLQSSVLHEIRRQQNKEYRDAMLDMSKGNVSAGLAKLDAQGWVHDGAADYLSNAADSWLKRRSETDSAILVSPTWREIDKLNEAVRAELVAKGELTGDESTHEAMDLVDYSAAQRRVPKNYEGLHVSPALRVAGLKKGEWTAVTAVDSRKGEITLSNGRRVNVRAAGPLLQVARSISIGIRKGDTLMLQGTDRKLGIINGERVTVLGVNADGAIRVRQERGRKKGREVSLPKNYKTFVHGYAVTAHKSQGVTVTHAIVAAQRIKGRETYVATSRGKKTIELHVPDKRLFMRGAKTTIDPLEAALDHRTPRSRPTKVPNRERLRRFLDQQRSQLVRGIKSLRGRAGRVFDRVRSATRRTDNSPGIDR